MWGGKGMKINVLQKEVDAELDRAVKYMQKLQTECLKICSIITQKDVDAELKENMKYLKKIRYLKKMEKSK